MRVEDGVSTCSMACWINRSSAVGTPNNRTRPRASGSSPSAPAAAGKCPHQALTATLGQCSFSHGPSSSVVIPSTPGAPAFCSTRRSARTRFSREKTLPQARLGGVRRGLVRRRGIAPLSTGVIGLHPPTLPTRPPQGLAAFIAIPTSTGVLHLGSAFGPSRPPLDPRRYYGLC